MCGERKGCFTWPLWCRVFDSKLYIHMSLNRERDLKVLEYTMLLPFLSQCECVKLCGRGSVDNQRRYGMGVSYCLVRTWLNMS